MTYRIQKIGLLIQMGMYDAAFKKIFAAYKKTNGNQDAAARALGVGRTSLKRWRAKLDEEGFDLSSKIDQIRSEASAARAEAS